jgi:hypothetical protein
VADYPGSKSRLGAQASAAARIKLHLRRDRDHLDSGYARLLPSWPLAQRQIRDFVACLGEPFAQVPVPTLGAADRVRVEAVENNANTHAETFTDC